MVIFLPICNIAFSEETIRLVTGEWPPFISKKLKHHGVVIRIIKESFAVEGISVQYEFFPWGRAEKLVKKGIWDGLAVEPENPAHYNSDVIIKDKLVFFHLKNVRFDWNKIADLKNYKIGGVIGNTYGDKITDMEKEGSLVIDRVSTEELNFRKLLKRRIDITPIGKTFGYSILNSHFSPQRIKTITYHPKQLRTSYYSLSLSKKVERNQQMLRLFNRGLQKLKKSGKYTQYIEEAMLD